MRGKIFSKGLTTIVGTVDAIEKAQDGDTISLEKWNLHDNKVIEIDKNLHFVGHVVPNPNGNGRMFNNTIEKAFS